jgi:outer membrane protein insertion porin family
MTIARSAVLFCGLAFCLMCLTGKIIGQDVSPTIRLSTTTMIASCPEQTIPVYESDFDPRITVAQLTFSGASQLPQEEQSQIETTVKEQSYSGDIEKVTDDVLELTREAWMNRGYFKARVNGESSVLSSLPANSRIAVAVRVDEGRQYRLEKITFRNNRVIKNADALRNLFPISDGEIAVGERIAEGLESLRSAYEGMGYINATFLPESRFDDDDQLVSVEIDIDEGKQFAISGISLIGENAESLAVATEDLLLKPGDIYNRRLLNLFEAKHPIANGDSETLLHFNEREGTVEINLDLRHCQTMLGRSHFTAFQ